jgi:hypothetical protein
MSRILLCDGDDALEIALLQAGHHVLRLSLPRGAIGALTIWPARRAAEAFRPDCLIAAAQHKPALSLARQLGVLHLPPPEDVAFLLPRGLPAPFRPSGAAIAGSPGTVLPPDVVVIADEAPGILADCLAMGCAIVAPDTPALRSLLGPDAALFHEPASLSDRDRLCDDLLADPSRRARLGQAARALFEARHAAACAMLAAALPP